MIAQTEKNGKSVCLSGEFDLSRGKACYIVSCEGRRFEIHEFAVATSIYKQLSQTIENDDDILTALDCFERAARKIGYSVKEMGQ